MDIISIESGVGAATIKAAGVLRRGGIIVYPTDTQYGLGGDAFSNDVVDMIYAIKGRPRNKPIHCVVADLAMAEQYAEINDAARKIIDRFLPGALTLILKKKTNVLDGIGRDIDTIGIRIPDNEFCRELATTYGRPFTTTSANKSDILPAFAPSEILAQFGDDVSKIDLIVDGGRLPESRPSTVVNLLTGKPSIIREGAVPGKDILALFQ